MSGRSNNDRRHHGSGAEHPPHEPFSFLEVGQVERYGVAEENEREAERGENSQRGRVESHGHESQAR